MTAAADVEATGAAATDDGVTLAAGEAAAEDAPLATGTAAASVPHPDGGAKEAASPFVSTEDPGFGIFIARLLAPSLLVVVHAPPMLATNIVGNVFRYD
jgi:hypothetical protein